MKKILLALALLLLPLAAFAFQTVLGEVSPSVTPANIKATICTAGYTDTVRPSTYYTNRVKALLAGGDEAAARTCVATQYSLLKSWHKAVYACAAKLPVETDAIRLDSLELDHKVPLEIGGHPDSLHNLQLQSWPEARKKDVVETQARKAICAGRVTLRQGQRRMIEPL